MSFDEMIICLLGIGLCFIAAGVFSFVGFKSLDSYRIMQQRCSEAVIARVIDYIEQKSNNFNEICKLYWKPIFSFSAGGKLQHVVSKEAYRPKPFYKDAFVHISYNPNNPQEILLPQAKWRKYTGYLFCIFGILCGAGGILLLVYLGLNFPGFTTW